MRDKVSGWQNDTVAPCHPPAVDQCRWLAGALSHQLHTGDFGVYVGGGGDAVYLRQVKKVAVIRKASATCVLAALTFRITAADSMEGKRPLRKHHQGGRGITMQRTCIAVKSWRLLESRTQHSLGVKVLKPVSL